MHTRTSRHEMDMTQGAILPKILLFALPLMCSSVLQLLFNAADVIVVGRFAENGELAVGAVGSTTALINLLINLFLGLSIGTNVVVARYFGANKMQEVSETVHTSIAISLVCGVILAAIGYFFADTFLTWMGSPDDVLPLATKYMKVFFLGMPVNMLYNFGAAVLRAVGDTRRPLIFLSIAGVINVLLNLFFVIELKLGVVGVALATIISQAISAILVLRCLLHFEGSVRLDLKKLRISMLRVTEIAKIGMPAGIQGMCFSISNVLIQSTINSFKSVVVSGNSIAANLEGFLGVSTNSLHQAAITFTSQNVGAKKYSRLRRICVLSVLSAVVISLTLSGIMLLFQDRLLGMYAKGPEVVEMGKLRLQIMAASFVICGVMDVMCGALRGLGSTIVPMVVSVMGACVFRIFWIYCIYPLDPTLEMLYYSYPVSWFITAVVHMLCYMHMLKKFPVNFNEEQAA